MKQALWYLLDDYLSAILFLIAYALSGSVRIAALGAAFGTLGQLCWLRFQHRRIEPAHWASLALILVLGGATVVTQNPRFFMGKPSVIHFAIAAAMLRRGWMIRYITPVARRNVSEATMVAAGYAWAVLMAALGLANAIILLNFDLAVWAWFVAIGAVGAKAAGVAVQHAVFRVIVRRRPAQAGT